MNDRMFFSHDEKETSSKTFLAGIRFYAWSVSLFSEDSLVHTKNAFLNANELFPKIEKEIEKRLFETADIYEFINNVEKILLSHINETHRNRIIQQALHKIIAQKGNVSICELKQELFISDKQLERLFKEYIGVSPKTLASLIRYQYLWNTIIAEKPFSPLDLVDSFGYTDQAHMLNDFKKYHGMNITNARMYAYQNVENLQAIIR